MVVRRGCSGTDIPVVYLHSLSKQVHSVNVSIVTYFRPGAQNCNLYYYYMINILNVIVVRSNAAFLKWTCFCLPHLLSYKQSVLQIHCLYYVIDILFSNLQRKQSSMNCSFCFVLRVCMSWPCSTGQLRRFVTPLVILVTNFIYFELSKNNL